MDLLSSFLTICVASTFILFGAAAIYIAYHAIVGFCIGMYEGLRDHIKSLASWR